MARWDEYFAQGLGKGADLAQEAQKIKQQQRQFEAEQAFRTQVQEQNLINQKNELKFKLQDKIMERAEKSRTAKIQMEGFTNALQGGQGGGVPIVRVPDPSKAMGFRTEIDPTYKSQIEIDKQVSAQESKKTSESNRNFMIAKNKLRTTMAAFKAMAQETGDTGRVAGAKNLLMGATGKNPYVKAYEGQLVEAAASLAKLAAPSARVGQEIIQQFKKTLPTKWSTMQEAENQIRFSLHNAFSTALGQDDKSYTPEIQAQVDEFVNEIIGVEPMSLNTLRGGSGKLKSGITYKVE